jgi:hypothetical protein
VARSRNLPVGWIFVVLLVLLVVFLGHRAQPPGTARRVALWGDSLAWEAQGPFTQALAAAGDTSVITHTYGGTAPCDWLDDIHRQASSWHPAVAVLSFSGNEGTGCMKGRDLLGAYRLDVTTEVAWLSRAGARVLLVESPPRRDQPVSAAGLTPLDQVWVSIASELPDTTVVNAGSAVTGPTGGFAQTLPCRPGEQCGPGGQATVRAPDGVHFCPVTAAPMVACPVPSPGASRYGQAMAAGVLTALGATPSPTATAATRTAGTSSS